MKKIILCFALLLATTAAQAQLGVKFGVEAGMNVSKVDFSSLGGNFSSDNRYGFYVGPKMNLSILAGFGVDAAVLYNQKRMNLSDDYSRTLRSVEIPLNARYTIGLGKLLGIYVATGPQFGWNIGNTKWTSTGADGIRDTFKRKNANVSWNFGGGFKVLDKVEIGVGYNLALSKYAKAVRKVINTPDTEGKNYDFKTNTVQLQVAYLF